ncbi:sialic acid synthase-like [Embiotoca jacksoni]|uniref:sialic acid synthase-like n=1 Tax=Embiotoca jacksoni TaxID=100190 RepID=UPI003704149A
MVVSTGMQSMGTIRRVYETVKRHNPNFTLLQCTSAYPLDPKEVNLNVIKGAQQEEQEPEEREQDGRTDGEQTEDGRVTNKNELTTRGVQGQGRRSEGGKKTTNSGHLVNGDNSAGTSKKDCGADCAKFQKSELENKFNKRALERPYTSKHSWGKMYGEHKRHLEFSHEQYRELQKYAKEVGIFFTASGMDEMAVEFLNELNVPFFKVGSGDTNNFPYLEKTAKKGRPMVVSSGMQSMETMRHVYKTVKEHNQNFTILQCTSAYPLEAEDVNLRVIMEYQKEFPDIPIGYSGHESGINISVAAVALGAKVIERHITLDKTWKGSDHAASLEPSELTELVRSIRLVEKAKY